MPASIEVIEIINHNALLKIILREGRNRQIRRIAISSIKLNELQEGKWRELKTKEWISLLN